VGILEIADFMANKTIDNVDIVNGASELIITFENGATLELCVDSFHMSVPELDD